MDWLTHPMNENFVALWEQYFADWFFVLSLAFLAFELIRYIVLKRMSWQLAGDTLTNFITLYMFFGMSYILVGAFYLGAFSYFHQFALFEIEINWATVLISVVLADLVYYWEHRMMHRVGIGWATHTVHHSSPFFNISVAYRFGPLDGLFPILFHIPLVLIGFNPFVVFFAEMFVQLFQTALHTEVIRKLPRPIEAFLNTPSHHRVHHGSNEEYIDKNYAGIFIVWDRMFGTFAEEKAKVVYGITTPIASVNPLIVFFHGLTRFGREIKMTPGLLDKMRLLIKPPGWQPDMSRSKPGAGTQRHIEGEKA